MADLMTVRTYQSKYGLSVNMGLGDVIRILATPYYSFNELKNSFLFNQLHVFHDQGDVMPFLMEKADIAAPDKQIFSIPDADHMPFLSNKVEFDRILLEEIAPKLANRS